MNKTSIILAQHFSVRAEYDALYSDLHCADHRLVPSHSFKYNELST
jgi:hypothetical protein